MNRIVIIGAPGAGKSTLAAQLGQLLRIDVFHLDALYWRHGVALRPQEWAALERGLIAGDRWILDGNYSSTLSERLAAADTAVFLDLPTPLCLLRFVRRRLAYRSRTVPGMAPVQRSYVNARVLRQIVAFRADHRPAFLQELSVHASGRRIVILRTRADVRRFLAEVRQAPVTA